VIAWRKSFTRQGAIDAVRKIVLSCALNGVTMLPDARQAEH
jgi:LysR family hydrogen peroxide-inducible transcriptional activator